MTTILETQSASGFPIPEQHGDHSTAETTRPTPQIAHAAAFGSNNMRPAHADHRMKRNG